MLQLNFKTHTCKQYINVVMQISVPYSNIVHKSNSTFIFSFISSVARGFYHKANKASHTFASGKETSSSCDRIGWNIEVVLEKA